MKRRGLVSCLVIAAAGIVAAQSPARNGGSPSGIVAVNAQNGPLLRSWDATVEAMRRDGDLVLSRSRADTVLPGRTHERYQQYVNGIRVVGGELTRQTSSGITTSIFGDLQAVSGVADRPELSEDHARERFTQMDTQGIPTSRAIELVVLPINGQLSLAYTTHVVTDEGWMRTYIDATDGHVLLQYDDRQSQSAIGTGTGVLGDTKKVSARALSGRYVADDPLRPPVLVTYDFQGNVSRALAYEVGAYTPVAADIASDTDNTWTDGPNVDAHAYVGYTYDYYFKRLGRKGLDDRNAPIFSVTHPVRRSDYLALRGSFPEYFANAFWCEGCGPQALGFMVFGEGVPAGFVNSVGQTADYMAGALDVIAHELTHAVTSYTSRLVYLNESGALNESYSDIVGTSVEFFYQTPGTGLRQADYLIGEDVFRPGGIRSMSNPAAFDDPDHYSKRYVGREDGGGVHTNSGIPNQAFYLAIEGGTNRTSGLSVQGVGSANREQVEKAFYRAFAFMLTSNATFSAARSATTQAARDLYGAGSPAERAITQAWTAVGVN